MKRFYSFLVLLNYFNLQSSPQVGFNNNGYINSTGSLYPYNYRSIAIDKNNKIIVVGQTDRSMPYGGLIARYNQDGTLDATFNPYSINGGPGYINQETAMYSAIYYSAVIDNQGRIIVAGEAQTPIPDQLTTIQKQLLARYLPTGVLDQTFGNSAQTPGYTNENGGVFYGCALDAQGKIILVGQGSLGTGVVVRYSQDGIFENTTFSQNGFNSFQYNSVVIDNQGRIIAVGKTPFDPNRNMVTDGLIVRFNSNGTLDTNFNNTGFIDTGNGTNSGEYFSVVIDKQNKIILAGTTQPDPDNSHNKYGLIVRLNDNGSLDTTFNQTGFINTENGIKANDYYSVAIDNQNKIIAAGRTYGSQSDNYAQYGLIVRFNHNGTLDTTFNGTGFINTNNVSESFTYYGLAIDNQHKIIAAGYTRNSKGLIARFLVNGSFDSSSNWNSSNFREIAQINNIALGMLSK